MIGEPFLPGYLVHLPSVLFKLRNRPMHHFQDGEEARVIRNGADLPVVVFRQLGEVVYVFDGANRAYQFHVEDVRPAMRHRCAPDGTKGNLFRMGTSVKEG